LADAKTNVAFEIVNLTWNGLDLIINQSFANLSKLRINTSNTLMERFTKSGASGDQN
jgi:hypothetical protein